MLIAHRSGVVLSDFSVAALEVKLLAEDQRPRSDQQLRGEIP